MSFGIIFIGNGELSKKDYARYIEKHKLREVVKIYIYIFFLQITPRTPQKINNPDTYKESWCFIPHLAIYKDRSELLCCSDLT